MERYTEPTAEEMAISALFFVVLILGWILLGLDFAIGYLCGAILMFAQGRAFIKNQLRQFYGGQK